MDLDNEEIEATKRINLVKKVKECAKNTTREDIIEVVEKLGIEKEKSADEMLEELGYKKYLSDKKGILFFYIRSSDLNANEMERIIFYKNKTVGFDYVYCNFSKDISMQELQAINKKVSEMGWI